MKTPSQCISLVDALSLFLPPGLLDNFTLVDILTKDTSFILYLEEKAIPPDECFHLRLHSKGFFPEIEVQDFPIRGKAAYLRIKCRHWEDPRTGQTYSHDWALVASDTRKSVDKSPVYEVKAIPVEKVNANDYNPNVVAPPEMKLLELSIWEDGFTMPCVCYYNKEEDNYILVDGYHRYTVLKTSERIYKRENGLLPIVVIDKDLSNRMSSIIRDNRARGTHNIELMCNIVAELDRAGMSDQWIMKNIGMDRDELLRLKQISGLADLFANREFSIPDEVAVTEMERNTVDVINSK